MSRPTAHRSFIAHADALLSEPAPVRVLGIDETRRGKTRWEWCTIANKWVRIDPWDTGFVDIGGDQGLLGQMEGRTGAAVVAWLQQRTPAFRQAIEFVAIDPAAVYAKAVRTRDCCRTRGWWSIISTWSNSRTRRSRRSGAGSPGSSKTAAAGRSTPSGANRKRLLTAQERLSDKNFARMWNAMIDEDPSHQILMAYIGKEELRKLLSTVKVGGDPHLTRHRLHRFFAWCADSNVPELIMLATTVDTWWPEINAFLETGITNARTEGYNRLVKAVKRSACGFRNLENSQRRIRFRCTRQQRGAAQQISC